MARPWTVHSELHEVPSNPVPPGGRSLLVRARDGVRLRAAQWPARGTVRRGTVLVIQGRNEFIEKYFETIADLQARGFAVATFDFRNQGGSDRLLPGGACHVEGFADYDRDLDAVLQQVMLPDCPPPYFAMAHSTGALVALRAASAGRARFERMALLTPLLGLSRFASPPMPVVRFYSGAYLFFGFDETRLSARSWQRWKDADPELDRRIDRTAAILDAHPGLGSGRPTMRWLHSAALAMKAAATPEFAARIRIPSLLFIAGRDNVVANDAQERLSAELRAGSHVLVPGARHEILMESDALRAQFWAGFDAFIPGTPLPVDPLRSKDA